jgi:ABC-type amino acid transport substrate-binding protein
MRWWGGGRDARTHTRRGSGYSWRGDKRFQPELVVNLKSGIRKLEDLKGRVIGVSQYGSNADGFARVALGKAGPPERDVAILQLGGHPQVAVALVAGKLDAGVLGGLALVTAQKSEPWFLPAPLSSEPFPSVRSFQSPASMLSRIEMP